MTLLTDWQIRDLSISPGVGVTPLISPFTEAGRTRFGSYGLSAYGYDLRLANQWLVPVLRAGDFVYDTHESEMEYRSSSEESYVMAPHGRVLTRSIEVLSIPRYAMGIVTTKSTPARLFIDHPSNTLEPEWYGTVTLEMINLNPFPIRLYAGDSYVQVLFMMNSETFTCDSSYADKRGRYQGQLDTTPAKKGNE